MITAEEYELSGFFEVESELLDPQSPWVYNQATYKVIDNQKVMVVSIQPSYKDIKIELFEGGNAVFDLLATGIEDIKIENEILRIELNERQAVQIKRKPYISSKITAEENTE